MQILTKNGTRFINFIPRTSINNSKTHSVVIKSEGKNEVIYTDNDASFT